MPCRPSSPTVLAPAPPRCPGPAAASLRIARRGSRGNSVCPFNAHWYPTLTNARLSRRTIYQTRHMFASNALAAGEAPSWVAAMLGHGSPEMLFNVYVRYIPNRTRRDGSALMHRNGGSGDGHETGGRGRCGTPEILPLT